MKRILSAVRSALKPATIITVITSIVAIGVFPKKAEEAYTSATTFLGNLPSPLLSWWYENDKDAQRSLALSLLQQLHPAADLCIANTEMVDVNRTGWSSDLFVEYDLHPKDPTQDCGHHLDRRTASVAMFGPKLFSYQHMGTIADPMGDSIPRSYYTQSNYIFAYHY